MKSSLKDSTNDPSQDLVMFGTSFNNENDHS